MVIPLICDASFNALLNSQIIPLSGMAGISAVLIIGVSYLFAQATRNDKMLDWSKTEIFQVFISIIAAVLVVALINGFCGISMDSITGFFGYPAVAATNLFEGAKSYLVSAAEFTHKVVVVQRYYLASFSMLDYHSLWKCDWGCLFGSSGQSVNPDAGYASILPGISLAFNSSLFAYLSSLNYLFILLFTDSGLVLLFLPLGIFLRSMPYMRPLGSLLIAVSLSFMIIYPFILASFSLVFKDLFVFPNEMRCYVQNEQQVENTNGIGLVDYDSQADDFFFKPNDSCDSPNSDDPNELQAMKLAGSGFLAGVFLPTIAMLATIGNVRFISRTLGEDIDLSRIVQML